MDNYLNDLHEMCETLGRSLRESNSKIRDAGGKLSTADMDFVNKLTHAMKSIKATIAMIEAEQDDGDEYSGRYSRNSYRGSYDGGSYARGRGRYANRDSMGRYSGRMYSRDGYSGHGEMVEELRDLMQDAPDDQTRQELQNMIQRLERR